MSTSNIEDSIEESNESATPLRNVSTVSSLDGELTRREQLKIRFKLTYRMRRLKNKGAIMILIWNFLIASLFFSERHIDTAGNYGTQFSIRIIVGGVTLTIAGWLADVFFGRYKVICFSMWIIWVFYMLNTANNVVLSFIDGYKEASTYVKDVFMIIVAIGIGAFQANIIQFGMDQLHDASTDEITSFIAWYVWTGYAGGVVAELGYSHVPKDYELMKLLLMCILLSIALCLLLCFKHLLVKEPVTQNPFKHVYNVVKYAIKNKYPKYRSAFTYCEDELPSRIRLNMGDRSQQSRWKMSRHSFVSWLLLL